MPNFDNNHMGYTGSTGYSGYNEDIPETRDERVFGQDSIHFSGSADYTVTNNGDNDWVWTHNFIPPTRKLTQSQKLKLAGKLI